MKLLTLRNVALIGAMGTAGLGLVGAGAHAVFTQSTTSTQSITAGTLATAEPGRRPPGDRLGPPCMIRRQSRRPVSASKYISPKIGVSTKSHSERSDRRMAALSNTAV